MNRLLENDQKLSSNTLHGRAWCELYSAKVDEWLAMLWNDAAGDRTDVALVATGGHGRSELCPNSDLDLLLVYTGNNVDELAKALWYPMWDIGVKLGHAVRTVDGALSLARDDLDVATSLLSTRCVAGSADARATNSTSARMRNGATRPRRALDELRERVEERQAKHGEVAFLLEPDLKEGRGGLRDVHSLWWAEAALPVLGTSEQTCLAEDYETLLATRVELHRVYRPSRRAPVAARARRRGPRPRAGRWRRVDVAGCVGGAIDRVDERHRVASLRAEPPAQSSFP